MTEFSVRRSWKELRELAEDRKEKNKMKKDPDFYFDYMKKDGISKIKGDLDDFIFFGEEIKRCSER